MSSYSKNESGLDAKGKFGGAALGTGKTPLLAQLDQLRTATAERLGLSLTERFDDGSVSFCGQSADGLQFYFRGYIGRRKHSDVYYTFKSTSERDAYAERWNGERRAAIAETNARKAEVKKLHTLKTGDILCTSWGYEQTNVEFYEVMAVLGSVVDLHELQKDKTEDPHGMQGVCTPKRGHYRGELIKGKRPNGSNSVRFESFRSADPWDGQPQSWSSYA